MTSLYSHNHYGQDNNCFKNCINRLNLPSIAPRTVQIIASVYFLTLFVLTAYAILFIDYRYHYNLYYYQIYYVLFFSLILLVVIASSIRQRYCDGHPIVIPMWLLAITNAMIFFIGFAGLFEPYKNSTPSIIFAYIIGIFNQLTLIIIVIYSIYRTFCTTNSNNQNHYGSDHRQYALAATAELDADTDIELELDLYAPSDHYHPYDDNNDHITHATTPTNTTLSSSLSSTRQTGMNSTTTTNNYSNNNNNQQQKQPKKLDTPNWEINLGDEFTDVE